MTLSESTFLLNGKSARVYNLKSTKNLSNTTNSNITNTVAHFYGGNGFAVGVYEPLLTALSQQFNIYSLGLRGNWYDKPTDKKLNRQQDADLLIEYLDQTQNKPVIGIGHSQGATATAMAAAKRPDLFSALYLFEPVTFTRWQAKLYNHVPTFIKQKHEPFISTQQKQNNWQSVEAYYSHLRNHSAYKRISDEHLKIYANGSLETNKNGQHQLIFPAEQELANYCGDTPFIDDALLSLNKKNVPFTIIAGKPSIFISSKVRKNWQKFLKKHQLISLPEYGHLLPLEAPSICAQLVLNEAPPH